MWSYRDDENTSRAVEFITNFKWLEQIQRDAGEVGVSVIRNPAASEQETSPWQRLENGPGNGPADTS